MISGLVVNKNQTLTNLNNQFSVSQIAFQRLDRGTYWIFPTDRSGNTRIPVWTIVSLHNQGADEVELLRNFPSLTLFDLAATRAYYATHRAEIDSLVREAPPTADCLP
jgi:Protein of unknown function (DUF433)